MSTTTEVRRQRLHNVHEHLRHDSTSDAPEIVRERIRQVELAQERQETEQESSTQTNEYWDR